MWWWCDTLGRWAHLACRRWSTSPFSCRGADSARTSRSSPTAGSQACRTGILIGHICPEAARGGPIGVVRNGDAIVIDPQARTLDVVIDEAEMARRMAAWDRSEVRNPVRPGSVLDKYARLVSSAHYGCVL